jgi:hypothetical protein
MLHAARWLFGVRPVLVTRKLQKLPRTPVSVRGSVRAPFAWRRQPVVIQEEVKHQGDGFPQLRPRHHSIDKPML